MTKERRNQERRNVDHPPDDKVSRRDFLQIATGGGAVVGANCATVFGAWEEPF